jgi:hypothetical protein
MTTKYNIGTLNNATLASLGFTLVNNDITLQNCINGTKLTDGNAQYVAISNSAPANDPLNIRGTCYKGINYNPKVNPDDTSGILYDIYAIPAQPCTTVQDCLINNSKKILEDELREIDLEKYDVSVRLFAIKNNLSYNDAKTRQTQEENQKKLEDQLKELNVKKAILEKHKQDLLARNSEASILLSDKNRLLATVNTNIQQKYTKLEDVNNKINTITQDIYTNNLEMKRKENIIQTLKVIILIVLLMAIILVIYFSMEIIEEKYPNAINNMVNNFNNNINKSILY